MNVYQVPAILGTDREVSSTDKNPWPLGVNIHVLFKKTWYCEPEPFLGVRKAPFLCLKPHDFPLYLKSKDLNMLTRTSWIWPTLTCLKPYPRAYNPLLMWLQSNKISSPFFNINLPHRFSYLLPSTLTLSSPETSHDCSLNDTSSERQFLPIQCKVSLLNSLSKNLIFHSIYNTL